MSVAQALVNSATVTPYTSGENADDGSPERTAGATFALQCSIQARASTEGVELGRERSRRRAVMYYLAGTTINPNDTVTLGSSVYRVIGLPRDVAGRGVFNEVDLEVESGG